MVGWGNQKSKIKNQKCGIRLRRMVVLFVGFK